MIGKTAGRGADVYIKHSEAKEYISRLQYR
jgi:hypothetical protein